MTRLAEFDVADRLAPAVPAWLAQAGFGIACSAGFILVRAAIDSVAPTAGPFALGYPAILIGTMFGRWRAGLVAAAVTTLYAWFFLLPVRGSFTLVEATDGPRIAVNAAAYLLTIGFAERFRRAVRDASAERDRQIAERDLFLAEIEHRVKNNFALVASLLELQRRRAPDPATRDALGTALARVDSIARAHRHLYRGGSTDRVDMRDYLTELCAALAEALSLRGAVTLRCEASPAAMPRDRAVPIGLIVNELVTNAVKHAFDGREQGSIHVRFAPEGSGWRMVVADDGVGMPAETLAYGRDGGLGQRMMDAFARQADGRLYAESGPGGTRYTLELAPG